MREEMEGKYPIALSGHFLVNPSDLNSNWKMRGGRLFDYVDILAALVARNHSGHVCNTVAGSPFKYFSPINTSQEVVIYAKITRAWNTSMEIRVEVCSKDIDGTEKDAFAIYLYFVAEREEGSENKKGSVAEEEDEVLYKVPDVLPQTEEEIEEYERADARREEVKHFIEEYIQKLKERREERGKEIQGSI